MAEMWYGDRPDMGLQLAELAGVLSGHLMRQTQLMKERADAGTLDERVIAQMMAEVAEQNAELSEMFAERWRAQGWTAQALVADQWARENRERLARMSDALLLTDNEDIAKATVTYAGNLGDIGTDVGWHGAPDFKKLFGTADKLLTIGDFGVALFEGDGRELAELTAKFVASTMIGSAIRSALVGIALAGGPLTVTVTVVIGVILAAASLASDEGVESFFETVFGETPEDVQSRIRDSIIKYGQTGIRTPHLGYTLHFGTGGDDYLIGVANDQNSITGGAGADTLYGGSLGDYVSGGSGADILRGEGGDDRIKGGSGNDRLEGGLGRDTLEGGEGFDTYAFFSAEMTKGGEDVVIDSDGLGVITIDGYAIDTSSLQRALGPATWDTADGTLRISVAGNAAGGTLIILHKGSGGRIIVNRWENGQFGISLPDLGQPGQPENPVNFSNGDDIAGYDGFWTSPPWSGDDFFNGMAGNDGIDGGYGDDWIDGGADNDLVLGGPGTNKLRGGGGNDVVLAAPMVANWSDDTLGFDFQQLWGSDARTFTHGRNWVVRGGQGIDRSDPGSMLLDFNVSAVVTIRPDHTLTNWVRYLSPEEFAGQADELLGGDGHDVLYGGEGADLLNGGTGNDLLIGGADDDAIYGEEGDDLILGDEMTVGDSLFRQMSLLLSTAARRDGGDVIHGGVGNDRIFGLGGTDTLFGGDGNDILQGDRLDFASAFSTELNTISGNDLLDGGAGDDELYGDGGSDTLIGGVGNDRLEGDSSIGGGVDHGNDRLDGGDGNDILLGFGGNDELNGGDGDDVLVGDGSDLYVPAMYQGDDRMFGGSGRDSLSGGGGNDLLDGGDDDDALWGGEGGDVLTGGNGNDQLVGDAGNDTLDGGAGDDRLSGGAHNDVLEGGDGNDLVQGGDGNDSLRGGKGQDVLEGDEGADFLDGGAGDDTLLGGAGADKVFGSDGNDYLAGDSFDDGAAQGDDILEGGSGNDTLVGGGGNDLLTGGVGDDLLFGDVPDSPLMGNDVLSGGAGNDSLDGGAGNDQLDGGDGDDTLLGGTGNDVFVGAAGNDVMDGGLGENRFEFAAGFGQDVVRSKAAEGAAHTYAFAAELAPESFRFVRTGGFDLLIEIEGSTDSLLIQNFFRAQGTDRFEIGTLLLSGDEVAAMTEGNGGGGPGTGEPIAGGDDGGTLTGTQGNDAILGGMGDDRLVGLAGNDRLVGGAGNDELEGGAGNDVYEFGVGFGVDRIIQLNQTGAGNDTIRFLPGSGYSRAAASMIRDGDSLSISFAGPFGLDVLVLEGFFAAPKGAHVIQFADGTQLRSGDFGGRPAMGLPGRPSEGATEGDDVMVGGAGDDVLDGGAGNDQMNGGDGSDVVSGAEGNDRLLGGAGDDQLYGGAGDDDLEGGAGDDVLYGGAGSDTFRWGKGGGNDVVAMGGEQAQRRVQLQGIGSGADLAFDRDGADLQLRIMETGETLTIIGYYEGGQPAVQLTYSDGTPLQEFDLWAGNNTLLSYDRDRAVLNGYGGNDYIQSYVGHDWLYGGLGDDRVDAGYGEDHLYGGDGDDELYGDTRFLNNTGWGESDYLDGGAGNDLLVGGGGNDTLIGGEGWDSLYGEHGDDVLIGGRGPDGLDGGYGSDTYRFSRGDGEDRIDEYRSYGGDIDVLQFDATLTPDQIRVRRSRENGGAQYQNDLVLEVMGTGDKVTILDFFRDNREGGDPWAYTLESVQFADGTTWSQSMLTAMSLQGTQYHDYFFGLHAEGDVYQGFGGNDYLLALDHDDTLLGGEGNDELGGGEGDDVLDGGVGTDYLHGDAGNDVYNFSRGSGVDFIDNGTGNASDFDVIAFGADVSIEDVNVARSGDALVIDVAGGADRLVVVDYFRAQTDWYVGGSIDALRFIDGTVWTALDVIERLGDELPILNVKVDGASIAGAPREYGGYIVGIQETSEEAVGARDASTWFDLGPRLGWALDYLYSPKLYGGRVSDTYVFGKGYGPHFIEDAGGHDQIRFNADVNADEVTIERIGEDVLLRLDSGDVVRVRDQFTGGGVESVVFNDGTQWDAGWMVANAVLQDKVVIGGHEDELLVGGIGNDVLYGLGGNDTLNGGEGNDTLDGGTGNDQMSGGRGDDTYVIDSEGDLAIEPYNQSEWTHLDGIDTVLASISYTVHDNIERVFLQGTADLNATGGITENVLIGNAGANVLRGSAPDQWYHYDDWLDGGAGNDVLITAWGDDTLIGGEGDDYMEGSGGADLYFVDSVGDVVVESVEEVGGSRAASQSLAAATAMPEVTGDPWAVPEVGVQPDRTADTVVSTIDYTLGDGVEQLVLRGTATLGQGNSFNNLLMGSDFANVLRAMEGDDYLYGAGGDDLLEGGEGYDELWGGAGNDILIGGEGSDTYQWRMGDGHDTIQNGDTGDDDLLWLYDVALNDLSFNRSSDDLVIALLDGSGSVTMAGWYADTANRMGWLRDSDWGEWSADDMESWAAGAPVPGGETTLLIQSLAQGGSAAGIPYTAVAHHTTRQELPIAMF